MRTVLFSLVILSSFSLIANYNEIVTNSAGQSKTIVFKKISVPKIYEIKDPAKVFKSLDINTYSNDILMKKLSPRLQVNSIPQFTSEIAKYDLANIVVNPVDINYVRLFNIDDNLDYINPSIDVAKLVDGSISIDRLSVVDINSLYSHVNTCKLETKDLSVPELEVNTIDVIVGESVYEELERLRNFSKFKRSYTKYGYASKAYLKDLDDLYDWLRNQWVEILMSNTTNDIAYIPNSIRYKIQAEVRLVDNTYDRNQLISNLEILKFLDYNSILVRFDCSEDLDVLNNLVDDIKSQGFNVFIAYVGLDGNNPKWNPFNVYPYVLERFINTLAPKSTGIMLNWRGMSAHVRLMPIEFYNYLCKVSRSANSNILIYGEIYYGRLDSLRERRSLFYNIPANVTGVLINNMGYYGYNHKYAINELLFKLIPNFKNLDKIGQVIGYVPYYKSRLKLGLSEKVEYKYKKLVEKSFRNVRCSTLTFLHDGIDDHHVEKYNTHDNILNEDLTNWELR